MKKQQKHYTPEFRAEAVKLVLEQGLTQEAAADRLSMPKGTLGRWVIDAQKGKVPVEPGTPSVAELVAENARLRKALAKAEMEREILKKATAYFAKES